MSETMTTFKFFWGHQDEEQESWLRAMSQQGLHLVKVNPVCFWTFRRGEPADIVYRLDFPASRQDPAFLQLLQDAGWSLAATTVGWQYWRTPAVNGKAPELFTDNASKARKFKALLALLVACVLPLLFLILTGDQQKMLAELTVPVMLIMAIWLLIVPYGILGLVLRIRKLSGPLPT